MLYVYMCLPRLFVVKKFFFSWLHERYTLKGQILSASVGNDMAVYNQQDEEHVQKSFRHKSKDAANV